VPEEFYRGFDCYAANGITRDDVARRRAELKRNPIQYQKNIFNKYPEPYIYISSAKRPPSDGYIRKTLFLEPPDKRILDLMKSSFGNIAVLKVRVVNDKKVKRYFPGPLIVPNEPRVRGGNTLMASCYSYWDGLTTTAKYIEFTHFIIEEIVEDTHHIAGEVGSQFTGLHNPQYREPEYAMIDCKVSESGYSHSSYYVIVYQDPDLRYQGSMIEFRDGQYLILYQNLNEPLASGGYAEVREKAYALIGLDGNIDDESEKEKRKKYVDECR
jgi:hypothetical protein